MERKWKETPKLAMCSWIDVMLVQIDTLHKTSAYYVMDCDMGLPDRGRLPLQIVFNIQLNLASLTRPGIRMTLVLGGLKIVTGSKKRTC